MKIFTNQYNGLKITIVVIQINQKMKTKIIKKINEGYNRPAKQVLVFNGAKLLLGIVRSVRGAAELTGANLQAVSFACTGRIISSNGFYYRHVHPNVSIEMEDLGTLRLRDYDELCGDTTRKYHTVHKMARNKAAKKNI